MRPASPVNGLAASGALQRSEHLYHEYGLLPLSSQAIEAGAQFARQGRHHFLEAAEHLRAHAVGHDAQLRVAVQPPEELADHRRVLCAQRVEADLDADVHAGRLPRDELRGSITRRRRRTAAMIAPRITMRLQVRRVDTEK